MRFVGLAPLVLVPVLVASCAHKEPEVDFKPIQLNWIALSAAAENHLSKDACVIGITSRVMGEKVVSQSKFEEISYNVRYSLESENLEFDGKCLNSPDSDAPECSFHASCSGPENIVVKFHNGD